MSFLCPQNYIPTNVSSSMEEISIQLPQATQQFQKYEKQQHSCDTVLKFAGKQFYAHKFVIQKSSHAFAQGLVLKKDDKWLVQVTTKAKTEIFTKILSCLYGHKIMIRRFDMHQAYLIAKSLQISQMLRLFEFDMMNEFDQYDIFPLLKLSFKEQISEVVEFCCDQLEIQMYEPIRYNKSGLLLCNFELFKTIVKGHNSKKLANQKFGLSYAQISQLIQQYCFINGLTKERKEKLLQDIYDTPKYSISLNEVFRKFLTPSRTKSTSQILQRTTLTLPRQKDQQNNSFLNKNRSTRSFNNITEEFQSNSPKNLGNGFLSLAHTNKNSSPELQKSISNISTDNKSLKNRLCRSRRESSGSLQILEVNSLFSQVLQISYAQNSLKQSQNILKERASELMKKFFKNLTLTKEKQTKLKKMENNLDQIKAEMSCNRQKLIDLEKAVDQAQKLNHQKKIQDQFNELFKQTIASNLAESTEFKIMPQQKNKKIFV